LSGYKTVLGPPILVDRSLYNVRDARTVPVHQIGNLQSTAATAE
jgi:hypothetical protein